MGDIKDPKPVPSNSTPQLPKVPENREIQGETLPSILQARR
jgi:hypothetical protein